MARTLLAGAAGAAVAVLVAVPAGSGSGLASRIVDRTIVCKVTAEGFPDPLRFLDVSASPRLGSQSPSLSVYSGPAGPDAVSAGLRTGADFGTGTGFVQFSRDSCTTTRVRVTLSSTGLRGAATALGRRYKCEVPATVLIRVRATFARPVTLRPDRHAMVARGRVATGELAVTTVQGRKPIAFTSVSHASGKAHLYVTPSLCIPT